MSETATTFFCIVALALMIFTEESVCVEVNRTFTLNVSSRRNQTGHSISQASLTNVGIMVPNHWKLKVHQSNREYAGIQTFRLGALAVAAPPLPADYQLFPGVGYYKFHPTFSNGFEDASSQCAKEGGHLVIVNSEAEHQVLQTLFAKHPESELKTVWAYVGFHDRFKEGEYITIFGQPLSTTGFTRWSSPGQPDDYKSMEDCGSVHRNGGLNDIGCAGKLPFVCEYDLSWADNED